MKPLGRTLCNFTSVAMQVTPNMARPDPSTCPCRHNRILFNTTDLFDGHVVSCNPQNIKNQELKKLFEHGAKFRQNIAAETILQSLGLGLHEFVNKKLKNCQSRELANNLKQWETLVYQKCKHNLETYMQNHPDPFKKDSQTEKDIQQLQNIFAVCPVDKTT